MDLRQLEYFITICEQKSFSRAVDVLDVSQPSLSRHIQQLEAELGVHLFRRTGRGVDPTEAGLRFLAHAQNIMREVRLAQEDMMDFREQTETRIRLGLPPRIARRLAPYLIEDFREAFPGARLNITEALSMDMFDWLSKSRIDIALLYDPPPSELLHYQLVHREELVLAYSEAYQPAPAPVVQGHELSGFPMVLPSAPNTIRALVEAACRQLNIHLQIVAEVDVVQSVGETTLQAQVCSVLPLSEVQDPRHGGRFRYSRIENPAIVNRVVIATPLAEARSHRLNEGVAELLHSNFRKCWPDT